MELFRSNITLIDCSKTGTKAIIRKAANDKSVSQFLWFLVYQIQKLQTKKVPPRNLTLIEGAVHDAGHPCALQRATRDARPVRSFGKAAHKINPVFQ